MEVYIILKVLLQQQIELKSIRQVTYIKLRLT